MMRIYFYFLLYFITLVVSAQQTSTDSLLGALQKDQLFFEKVFLHTNKTSYFINDHIWFKAYVGDANNKPSLNTTRLYVNLLDSNGKIIQDKNILIYKGTGKGQFELNDSLKFGTYYIQAYTNYMRNFGKNNYFIQKIKILEYSPVKDAISENNYDIQVFPEGGYLLEDIENVIGLKSLINGKGFYYSGKIVNSKNQEITRFKSEHLGMTRCTFFYKPKEKYTAIFTINDTIIKKDIPLAKSKGVTLNIDNNHNDSLTLNFKTNKNTRADLIEHKYTLLLHQRNQVIDFIEITNVDSTHINFKIDKNIFFNGVNTITLIKDNQPIIERKFYIEKEEAKTSISLKKLNSEGDSITYKLKISNSFLNKPIKSRLSISVLPADALNFDESTTIQSAFLLTPYVKGFIENPAYYFNKKNSERKEHLDLLLLTQGWTQYSLKDMIKSLNPSYKYDFELGFKLKGTVSPLLTSHLALLSKDNILIDKLFLNGKKDFSFDKLLFYKGDTVKISFLNNLNEAMEPKNIYFDSIKTKPFIKFNPKSRLVKTKIKSEPDNFWENVDYENSTKLNEVTIIGKKKSELYYKKKEVVSKYKHLVFDLGKYYMAQIPDHYHKNNDDLMSFLRMDQGVRLVNWKGLENYLQVGVKKEARLFINGKYVGSNQLSSVSLRMNDVQHIMIQPYKGNMYYQVFTTDNYKTNTIDLFKEYVFSQAYDTVKKYYSPKYDFNKSQSLGWTEIDWKTDLTTNANGETFIKIKMNKDLQAYLFSIQGFSEEGFLISEILKDY